MNNIKKIRKERHVTQTDITKLCGVSQQTVSNWENEKTEIDFENLKKLSNFFNVPIDELIGNNPPEAKGFPTLADFNKDLINIGFSIEQYEALNDNEKQTLLTTFKTLVQGLNKNKE